MNLAKFAAIRVGKGQRVGFSDLVSPKITQRKEKERKHRKIPYKVRIGNQQ